MDLYEQKRRKMLVWVQTMDLCEHPSVDKDWRYPVTIFPVASQRARSR